MLSCVKNIGNTWNSLMIMVVNMKYQCRFCYVFFETKEKLIKHLLEIHDVVPTTNIKTTTEARRRIKRFKQKFLRQYG